MVLTRAAQMICQRLSKIASLALFDNFLLLVAGKNGRTEWSLFYGSKYVFSQFDHVDYKGYTDVLGVELRHDIGHQLDIGFHADVRHVWSAHEVRYAYGPTVGITPFTNAWFSLGYTVKGYSDRDFSAAHHSQQGPFISFRYKFDQQTAKGLLGG